LNDLIDSNLDRVNGKDEQILMEIGTKWGKYTFLSP
jgi:hypothetical protein